MNLHMDIYCFSVLVKTSHIVLPHQKEFIKDKRKMLHWLRNTDSPRDSLWLQLLTFRKIMNNQITFLLFILFPTNHCPHIWGNYCVLPVQKLTLYRQNILIFGYLRWYWRRFGKRQFQRQGIKTSVLGMFYIKKKKNYQPTENWPFFASHPSSSLSTGFFLFFLLHSFCSYGRSWPYTKYKFHVFQFYSVYIFFIFLASDSKVF